MKLTELQPEWLHPRVFIFLCPHCQSLFLSCKNIVMDRLTQRALFMKRFGDECFDKVIFSKVDCAWATVGTFENLTVTPSIDASKSGHWHGHITNGEI